MVGKKRDCWAWSDDPDWEAKAEEATQAYADAWGQEWRGRITKAS